MKQPKSTDAILARAITHHQAGQLKEARALYVEVLKKNPGSVVAHGNLGQILTAAGQFAAATQHHETALRLAPKDPAMHNDMGALLMAQLRFADAAGHFEKAIAVDPAFHRAYNNLGMALKDLGKYDAAVEWLEKGLALNETYAHAHNTLGTVLRIQGKDDGALQHLKRAAELAPTFAEPRANLGDMFLAGAHVADAIALYREAMRLRPELVKPHTSLLFAMHYVDDVTPAQLFAEHSAFGMRQEPPLRETRTPHTNERSPDKRLRIGYVSPDFVQHPVASFIEPILRAHDRTRVEVFCYSNTAKPDAVTETLRGLSDHWCDVLPMTDADMVERIRKDGIDILVDLAGHTAFHRLMAMARKPAPVQVTYLGYPDTTGLTAIDYRLTDAEADPPGPSDTFHTEKLFRLRGGFLCYQPPKNAPDVAPSPVTTTGNITFGSFNHIPKMSPRTVALWASVMKAVPGSKMLLKAATLETEAGRTRMFALFAAEGIEAARLELVGRTPSVLEHLHVYDRVDIALDTFPYNGTTTTCEALWMGVPVVTLAGQIHASRVGVSILARADLGDLVATDRDNFVAIARSLAQDLPRLTSLRGKLRARMAKSPLTDEKGFARGLEAAYREMWRTWCRAKPEAAVSPPAPSAKVAASGSSPTALDYVPIEGGLEIAVPASLDGITSYVLREQGDWFEDEIKFVRKLIRPGAKILDVGANYGLYALTMARTAGKEGHVWAFEPAKTTASFLKQSIAKCGITNVTLLTCALSSTRGKATLHTASNSELNALTVETGVHSSSEEVELRTLDDVNAELGWQDIEFVKLDAEGEELRIVDGGTRFFAEHSPLVMFELKHGTLINLGLIERFRGLGYAPYALVPGLDLIAPIDPASTMDSFQLNVFGCREDRAAKLEAAGFLARPGTHPLPESDPGAWASYIGTFGYGKELLAVWHSRPKPSPGELEYHKALGDYARAHDTSLPPGDRYRLLERGFIGLSKALGQHANVSRLMSIARVASELGRRDMAVEALNVTAQVFTSNQPIDVGEPFLSPSPRFDGVALGTKPLAWCFAAVLERREQLRGYSSFFTGATALPALQALEQIEFLGPEMKRRKELLALRGVR